MSHNRIFILALTVLVLSFSACQPKELNFEESSLRPGQADASFSSGNVNMNFSSAAGSASVDLEATGKWKAAFVNDRAKDWCSLSTESGKRGKATITVSVKESADYDQRSASIQFTCGKQARTILVTQKQKDAVLISSNRLDVKEEGGNVSIEVRANIPYDYTISEDSKSWITPLGTRGLISTTLNFRVSRNEELQKREGGIVFRSGASTETVKVYQDGAAPCVIVSSSDVKVPSEGGPFSVEIRHNVSVSPIISPECKWIKDIKTRAMSTSTFHFSADKNNYRKDRQAWVAFKNDETNVVETLYVVQPLKTILVSKDTLYFSGRGSLAFFEVDGSDPEDYRIVPGGDWFSVTGQESVSGKGRYRVSAQALEKPDESRTGQVYVYLKDFSEPDTVRLRQFECFPAFSYSTMAKGTVLPKVEGKKLQGFVTWGDGIGEFYSSDLRHTYQEAGPHTVVVELRTNPKKVPITRPENGMKIDFKELSK